MPRGKVIKEGRDSSELLRKAADYLDCHKIKTLDETNNRRK